LPVKTLIKPSEYHDSVSLMLAARELARLPGVTDAAVVMATEANKGLLKEAGLLTPEANSASSNDLVIAVSGAEAALDRALREVDKLLQSKSTEADSAEFRPKTVSGAVKGFPAANVAVISVAGRYAADEAWEALHKGLHVLLFSDNVSLQDEIALKKYARDSGLLLMGPGAGTAILNGVALGFADRLPSGPVGIVSAAGTGLQEVSTLLAKRGVGVSQGIGTGGRDVKEEVGGIMMLAGLKALQDDPATELIVLVSKPPSEAVAEKVIGQVRESPKPTVICFLGDETRRSESGTAAPRISYTRTLEEAALLAANLAQPGEPAVESRLEEVQGQAEALRSRLNPGQRYLRGLFSGGTLCYEAQVIWRDALPEMVFSNAPLSEANRLPDSARSRGHCAVDLGEEEFTVGRPHPMIDNDLRIRRLLQEARDPETAVILLDVVIGYGAHPDPAGELGAAVVKARALAREAGRELIFIASVTGTEQDPQCLSRQVQTLEGAGVIVCASNAAAARLAAEIVRG
jgi:succinyl-CoA synthetase alpha subunit